LPLTNSKPAPSGLLIVNLLAQISYGLLAKTICLGCGGPDFFGRFVSGRANWFLVAVHAASRMVRIQERHMMALGQSGVLEGLVLPLMLMLSIAQVKTLSV
jgi:hypothetical protein